MPAMVNSTTSTREVMGALAAVVKKAAMPHQGIGDGMVPRNSELGERRAEQEAADAPDGQAGRQGAPHRTHAEDDGDGEDFQE